MSTTLSNLPKRFIGTKGAHYATVKDDYSNRDEGLYSRIIRIGMDKPLFFTKPPETIGDVLEQGSSLDAEKEYTILSASEAKRRKVAFAVLFILFALFSCGLTYAIFEDDLLSIIVYPISLTFAFIGADRLVYHEKNFLHGLNYFVGTKGGYLAEVDDNYDTITQKLYLYDEIKEIDRSFTIVKVENVNETAYYPQKLESKVHIRRKRQKDETHSFEFQLENKDDRYDIADTESQQYHLYRFLELLEREWAKNAQKAESAAPNPVTEDALEAAKPTPDPSYQISRKDLFVVIPLSFLIAAGLYLLERDNPDDFLINLALLGIFGGYVSGLFAAFNTMRLLQLALLFDLLWAFAGIWLKILFK